MAGAEGRSSPGAEGRSGRVVKGGTAVRNLGRDIDCPLTRSDVQEGRKKEEGIFGSRALSL